MAEMITLTLGGKSYEVVDKKARDLIGDITTLDAAEVQQIVEEYLAAHPPEPGEPGKPGTG